MVLLNLRVILMFRCLVLSASQILHEPLQSLRQRLALLLVEALQRTLFSFLDRLFDPGNGVPSGFRQKNMRLSGVLRRVDFGQKPLSQQTRNRLGDGGRAHSDFGGKRAGRLPVLPCQRQNQLVLTRIEILFEQPGCQDGAPKPRGLVQLLNDLSVFLRHNAYLLSQQAALRAFDNQANDAGK